MVNVCRPDSCTLTRTGDRTGTGSMTGSRVKTACSGSRVQRGPVHHAAWLAALQLGHLRLVWRFSAVACNGHPWRLLMLY